MTSSHTSELEKLVAAFARRKPLHPVVRQLSDYFIARAQQTANGLPPPNAEIARAFRLAALLILRFEAERMVEDVRLGARVSIVTAAKLIIYRHAPVRDVSTVDLVLAFPHFTFAEARRVFEAIYRTFPHNFRLINANTLRAINGALPPLFMEAPIEGYAFVELGPPPDEQDLDEAMLRAAESISDEGLTGEIRRATAAGKAAKRTRQTDAP